ncbi:MAG TPA: hypothetical protein VJ386_07055 [Candidatus Deferrimicrobiaceae bacterium]|jgi:hypothetical protein|nr:hypothetical protein [Candidatus Deferrimicrobiaceae bacterium]
MRSAAQADLAKYEQALNRYFQIPASARKTRDREKILKVVGVDNTLEFITMHIPLWEVKIDELLDPTCTDMLPISISHSYVNWVRGAIRLMPDGARIKIFSSKLKATGLKKAILQLLSRMTEDAPRDFEVTDVQLVEKVHKDTLFRVRDEKGKEFSLYLSRFGCLGEYIYSGLPGLVGLPVLPVVHHVTPQGEEVLLKPKEDGVNIFLDEGVTASRILREWTWWVEGAARQDALGDCIGTALRYGHYMAGSGKRVFMIDNIELFHLNDTDVRIFEPIHDFLPRKAFPDDQGKRDALQARMQSDYDEAYRDQMRIIVREWAEIERYLIQMRRHIRTYTGEVFDKVLANVRARVFGKR